MQGTLFPPASDWRPPRLADLPDWPRHGRVSIDTETCDPLLKKLGPGVRRGAWVAGFSFAVEGQERGWYVPLRHLGGDNVEDPARAVAWLRDQAARFAGDLVGAKLSYDLDFLEELTVTFPLARFRDVQVAEPLIDELQFSYSLDSILARRGLPLKDEALLREAALAHGLKDPKTAIHALPARYVGPYAEADALRPLLLLRAQEEDIAKNRLERVWELESRVLPLTVKMRRRGVALDEDQLDRVERWSIAEELKAWGEFQRHTGVAIPLGGSMKADVLAHALGRVGIQCPLTAKTRKPSITKEFLDALDHPAAPALRRARKVSQLRTTFVASVREHAVKGRIHATFNQVVGSRDSDDSEETEGARPGRFSCCDPNLQQQPARDPEIGPMWRSIYRPEPGTDWGCLDYSQQEPRGALALALASGPDRLAVALGSAARGQAAYESALEAQRRYREDPKTDSHTMFVLMVKGDDFLGHPDFKQTRTILKNVYLGVCYGMGGAKLCRQLGLPTKVIEDERGRRREVAGEEGQRLLNEVDARVPYIRATARAVEAVAKECGYIVTWGGRHLHFPKDQWGNYDFTHKAYNRAIQGMAADQTKTAAVALDAMGAYLQLQVHDELDISLSGGREEGLRYAREMEECFPLPVPSRVDLEIGPSWGEIK